MAEDKNVPAPSNNPTQVQPGTVITPSAAQAPQPQAVEAAPAPAVLPVPPPASVPAPPPPQPVQPAIQPVRPAQSKSEPVKPEELVQAVAPDPEPPEPYNENDPQSLAWTASEFIAHDKSAGWYIGLAIGTVALAAIAFLLTRGLVSVGVIIVAGILLGVYGRHSPRELEYRIGSRGIDIGQKIYAYDEFKSFAVVQEGAFSSIVFMPLKRFAVPITMYYAPEDEEQIVAILSDRLPFEKHRHDAVDSLMRRIRF